MNIATVRSVLLWCLLLNYGILALWGLLLVLPHVGVEATEGQVVHSRFDARSNQLGGGLEVAP